LLILLVRLTPWPVVRSLATGLGRLAWRFDARHRRIAEESVRLSFPEQTTQWHAGVVRNCYRHLALCTVEFARLASLPRERVAALWALTDEQVRFFDELCASKTGVIFVTGHVGLWEMCGLGHTAHGYRLSAIARPLDNEPLNRLIDGCRARFGQRVLAKRGALRGALHALRGGSALGMLLDQDAGRHGTFVPLFGRPASTLPTAAELALRTGARIACVTAWRDEAAGVHRLRLGRTIAPGKWQGARDERYREEVRRITAEYTAEVEAAVREHPEQWLWLHRRWKTRPPEEKKP
jgi:KDO2-lipid IV(A) lauroyltransferase